MVENGKRLTIGLLVSGIVDEFTMLVCKGVVHAAKEADVNLVVFPGKYLDRDLTERREIMYEYQYNTIFSYAKKENIDALIVSADSIGCYTTRERLIQMLAQYEGIPCILAASKIDGYVSVNYDNNKGIRAGMEYLIKNLKCRKFGMIGGPDNNTDAYERKQIFKNILEEYGIPFADKNYVEGNLTRFSGEVFQKLLDDNPDVEAVFCVNDDTAIGLYDEMKRRNLVPGKDIMVFGYDNIVLGAQSKPSLSSVWADPVELGGRAFQNVMRMVHGEAVTSEVLPTRFIKRNSFGTLLGNVGKEEERLLDIQHIDDYFDNIFYRYKNEGLDVDVSGSRRFFKEMMEGLIRLSDGYEADVDVQELFDDFLKCNALEYADMDNLLIYFEQIYHALKARKILSGNGYELKETFVIFYKKIIRAMDYRFGRMREAEENTSFSMKLFVRDILQFEKGNDQSYSMLLDNLGWMDVSNAYVYVFENPIMHLYREEFNLPEELYLKAVLRNGNVQTVPAIHQKKKIADIYSNSELNPDRYSMVMLPLFSNEILYGIVLCDLTDKMFGNGEFLVNQMSSAVKMIQLLRLNESTQQQLEESLVTLRENNIALDNLSKSDGLTGIYNRRGFYDAAGKLVAEKRTIGRPVLVAYVDMNNLKIINDRYGHEEGDFSLKLIGDILVETMGERGITGRIGGDEFACAIEYDAEDEGKSLLKTIYDKFTAYNEKSAKPYNVTVSAGAHVLGVEEQLDLKEALTLADEQLYVEKQKRVKIVAKGEILG